MMPRGMTIACAAATAFCAGCHCGDAAPVTAPSSAGSAASPPPGLAASTAAGTPTSAAPTGTREESVGEPPAMANDAVLTWSVRDADTHAPIPCKLTLLGVAGTPRPRLSREDIGRLEGGAVLVKDRIMSLTGTGVAHVPAGTYDIWVSRGPEWDVSVTRALRIEREGPTGAGAVVTAALHHVVDSAGWLSADFHVHAASSFDSRVPMIDRIYEFVSDGVEMIVSTDHNVVADYAPLITELGVGALITSATGDEITTKTWGHFGAFPLPFDAESEGGGAIAAKGRTAAAILGDVRAGAPGAVIDVHHPRLVTPKGKIGYFDLGALESATDAAGRAGFSFDFDAVEVLNGFQDPDRTSVSRVISDWFALLDHGHLVTATGNSDTHHLSYNIGGYPRNYVRLDDDRPGVATPLAVAAAVKAHHAFFTTGPFVRVRVTAAAGGPAGDIGDVVAAADGRIRVAIEVQAAPWVSVSSVAVYLNGRVEKRWTVAPGTGRVRFSEAWEAKVARDAHVVVRVDGDRSLAPVVGGRADGIVPKSFGLDAGRTFDVLPFALTNPVFIDVDGNGRFDPPHAHGAHAPAGD